MLILRNCNMFIILLKTLITNLNLYCTLLRKLLNESSASLHTMMQTYLIMQEGSNTHKRQRAELTKPSICGVSVPWVRFSLCGRAGLASSFGCLFSSRGSIFVLCWGAGAPSRFGSSGYSGTLLLFRWSFPRSNLVRPGSGFSIALL